MKTAVILAGAGSLLAASLAGPGRAGAEDPDPHRGRAVQFFLQGGGYSPLADMEGHEDVDFGTGFTLGGGLAYQFNEHVALRGNFNFASGSARVEDAGIGYRGAYRGMRGLFPQFMDRWRMADRGIDGGDVHRYLYDVDVQLRQPFGNGVTPYVFAGGGGVTVDRDQGLAPGFTTFAGKGGLGVGYVVPDGRVGVHLEAAAWVYDWGGDCSGCDGTQVDLSWTAGVSYRLPF
jgi:hypothetical protein